MGQPKKGDRTAAKRPGQAGGVRAENRRRRTETLLSAGVSLFLAHGLEAVTIDDIVQSAGMAKGSFYRYFEDKAALVRALFAPVAEQVQEAFAACDAALRQAETPAAMYEAYTALAFSLMRVVTENPDVLRLYLQECRGPAAGARRPVAQLAARIRERAIQLTEAARTHRLLRDIDPRVTALAVIGATERLLYAYLAGEDVGSPESVPAALITLVLEGLRADAR